MIRTKRRGLIFLAAAFAAVLILAQTAGSGTQTNPPPRPAGPPQPKPCDYDGNCEPLETNGKTTSEWCPDCEPKTYPPLDIMPFPQLVSPGTSFPFSNEKVFYYFGTDSDGDTVGEYRDIWASDAFNSDSDDVCAADVDNDGKKEIVVGTSIFSRKKKIEGTTVNYYYAQFSIFESGSTGAPAWTSPLYEEGPGDVTGIQAGDVDGDGRTEVVIQKGQHVSVYEISSSGGTYPCVNEYPGFCPDYEPRIFSFHVGDADNCGVPEIVLAMFEVGAPIIWKFDQGAWSSKTAELVDPEYWNPELSSPWLAIETARVRDADNLPGNEIVTGGNSNRLIIWRYNAVETKYEIDFIGDFLGGFTQGVDAGDIDGDGLNEVVVEDQGQYSGVPQLVVYKYQNGSYIKTYWLSTTVGGFIRVGDIDQDERAEIILDGILRIYEWIGGGLVQTFANAWGDGGEAN